MEQINKTEEGKQEGASELWTKAGESRVIPTYGAETCLLCFLEVELWESVEPVTELTNEVELHLESEKGTGLKNKEIQLMYHVML